MKFESNWLSSFRGEDLQNIDGQADDGHRGHWYTIRAPRSLRLWLAKKLLGTVHNCKASL